MPQIQKCPLCDKVLDLVHLPGLATLYGRNLPEWDPKSCYAADLAAICSFYISSSVFEDLTKGLVPIKNSKTQWHIERKGTSFALALALISSVSKFNGAVTGANAQYLRRELDRYVRNASELIQFYDDSPGLDYAAMCSRGARFFEESMRRANLKPRKDWLEMLPHVHGMLVGALAGAGSYLGVNPHRADSPISGSLMEFLEKDDQLSGQQISVPKPVVKDVDSQKPRKDEKSIVGDSRRDFPLWEKRCMEAVDERRLPRELFKDLIPNLDVADHVLRDARAWVELLEGTFPGRNKWLQDEGVQDSDIEDFWGAPPWVQNFREALVKREFELQVSTTVKGGVEFVKALSIALFFMPTFSIACPSSPLYRRTTLLPVQDSQELEESGFFPEPLPFELFSRVNNFMSKHTDREKELLLMGNDVRTMNALCRKLIADGKL